MKEIKCNTNRGQSPATNEVNIYIFFIQGLGINQARNGMEFGLIILTTCNAI